MRLPYVVSIDFWQYKVEVEVMSMRVPIHVLSSRSKKDFYICLFDLLLFFCVFFVELILVQKDSTKTFIMNVCHSFCNVMSFSIDVLNTQQSL